MKVFYNGPIYTMDQQNIKAVVVEDNKIIDVLETIDHDQYKDATWIDLKGCAMFPGFVDTHIHLVGTGKALLGVRLNDDTDIEVIKEKIKQAAMDAPDDGYIVCEGYNDNQLNGYKISRAELDAITHKKVIVKRVCRHAAVVNSAVFEAMNIQEDVQDMPGGHYERTDGKLNGWVHDLAMEEIVLQSLNETETSLTQYVNYGIQKMHEAGLTGVHTEDLAYYNNPLAVLKSYQNVIKDLPMRINILRHTDVIETVISNTKDYYNDFLYEDAMKFYIDGALGGRTALFYEPYNDDPSTSGLQLYTVDELEALVKKARALDANVAVHMIGDYGCELVLNAIEKYPPKKGRDRLIHCSFLNETLIKRISQLPVICDIQPSFVASDFPFAIDRVGHERIRYSYPWKSLLEHHIICGGGSDSPIEDYRPMTGIDAAVNRKAPNDSSDGYNMAEALTVEEAIRLYTVEAAKVANRSESFGTITKGKMADFTILKQDPFQVERHLLHTIEVAMTVVDGKIVYQS